MFVYLVAFILFIYLWLSYSFFQTRKIETWVNTINKYVVKR